MGSRERVLRLVNRAEQPLGSLPEAGAQWSASNAHLAVPV